MKPPGFIECSVCGREFGSKSIVIHERQCLQKLRRTEITEEAEPVSSSKQIKKRDRKKSEKSDDSPVKQSLLPKIHQEPTHSNKTPELRSSKLRPLTATLSKPKILNLEMKQFDMTLTRIDYSTSQLIISDETENHKRSITLPSVYSNPQPSGVPESSPTNQKFKNSTEYGTLKLPQSSLTTISSLLGETEPYNNFVVKSDTALPQTRQSVIKTPFLHTMSSLIQKSVSFALFPILSSFRPSSLKSRSNSTESLPQMQIIRRTKAPENILTSTISEVPDDTFTTGEVPVESNVEGISYDNNSHNSEFNTRTKSEKKETLEAQGPLEFFNEEFFVGYPETLLLEADADDKLKTNDIELMDTSDTLLKSYGLNGMQRKFSGGNSESIDPRNDDEEITMKRNCIYETELCSTPGLTHPHTYSESRVFDDRPSKSTIEIIPNISPDMDEALSLQSYTSKSRNNKMHKVNKDVVRNIDKCSGSDCDEETDHSGFGLLRMPGRRRKAYRRPRTEKFIKRRKGVLQSKILFSNLAERKETAHFANTEINPGGDTPYEFPKSPNSESSEQTVSGIISAFIKIEEQNRVRTYKFIDQLKIIQPLQEMRQVQENYVMDKFEHVIDPLSNEKLKIIDNEEVNKSQYVKTNSLLIMKCDKSMQFPEMRTTSIQNSPLFHKRQFPNTPIQNGQSDFGQEQDKKNLANEIQQFNLSTHDIYQIHSSKLIYPKIFPGKYSDHFHLLTNSEKEIRKVISNWEEFETRESSLYESQIRTKNTNNLLTKFYTLLIPKFQNSAAPPQMSIIFLNKDLDPNFLASRKYSPNVTYLIIEQAEPQPNELDMDNISNTGPSNSSQDLTKSDYEGSSESESTIVPSSTSTEFCSKSEMETQTPRCLYDETETDQQELIKHFYTINGIRYKSIFRVNTSPSFFRL